MMVLSVVTTLYCSAEYVEEFYKRIIVACEEITQEFEIVFVNDGSPDDSLQVAIDIHRQDSRVKIIDLSRNFGHHRAIMVGLSKARGEKVFLIDSDLEESPDLISSFYHQLSNNRNIDMVYGVQSERKGGWFESVSGFLFYKIINSMTNSPIPTNFMTVRLMTRRFVEQLCQYKERELNFSTLVNLTGFESVAVCIEKGHKGESSYTLGKKIKLLVDAITCSTARPLWLIFVLGLIVTVIAFSLIIYFIMNKFLTGVGIDGWTSLIVSIWFIGGMLMSSIGVIGLYLSRIFIEVKQRPYVNIRKMYD